MSEPGTSAVGRRRFDGPPRIALEPLGARNWLADAIEAGGGRVVAPPDAEALVWASPSGTEELADLVAQLGPALHWVQLPWAGIEPFVGVLDHDHLWTCGKGIYAEPVAEHALTLALGGLRGLATYARAQAWAPPQGRNLLGARVVVIGAGGIAESFLHLLAPFRCHVTVVRRRPTPFAGAERTISLDELDSALPTADLVVIAAALTPETQGVIDARRLAMLPSHAWVLNVGRGGHIVTDDLVAALAAGSIGGAALDVTDPEPLPADHPLWTSPRCLITPHVGNTPEMAVPLLSERVTANVGRFATAAPLIGVVDVDAGY